MIQTVSCPMTRTTIAKAACFCSSHPLRYCPPPRFVVFIEGARPAPADLAGRSKNDCQHCQRLWANVVFCMTQFHHFVSCHRASGRGGICGAMVAQLAPPVLSQPYHQILAMFILVLGLSLLPDVDTQGFVPLFKGRAIQWNH